MGTDGIAHCDARPRRGLILAMIAVASCAACGNDETVPRPIVDAETGQMYGAVRQGRWIGPDLIEPRAVEQFDFTHYDQDGRRGATTRLHLVPTEETCSNPTYRPVAAPPAAEAGSYLAVDWNAAPRTPTSLNPNNATYRAALSDWLAAHEIEDPEPRIDQLPRVDLDGDGRDEVILAADRQRGSITSARAGDYSVLLLRGWEDGRVVTFPVLVDLYPEDCVAECAPARYQVFSILDLDGDGRLEMIVTIRDYEGVGRAVYGLDDLQQPRLRWRCGP